jgi:hypothetical protein
MCLSASYKPFSQVLALALLWGASVNIQPTAHGLVQSYCTNKTNQQPFTPTKIQDEEQHCRQTAT